MATYQDIKGLRVKYLAADPSVLRLGDVWYNSTTGTLKGNVLIASTTSQTGLSRGGSYNQMASASGGSANAAWVAGGSPPVPSGFNETEEFNGSGWTTGGNMNYSGFNRSGFGTLTAGVAVGGRTPAASVANTELYDGTTWTNNPNAAPVAARGYACGGPQTAGIVFSGHAAPAYPVAVTITQYYDGSAWSVPPATMNTPRANASGCGIQTAALAVSGESGPTPTAPTTVEEYNGSAWATTTSLNTGRGNQGPAMCQGSTTSATMLGGNSPSGVAIENWDGTSWTTSPASLVNANSQAGGQGSSSIEILKAGGNSQATCEKYEESMNSITAAAWASITAYPTPATGIGGVGSSTAGLFFGGENPGGSPISTSTTYDGSSWTAASAKGNASQLTLNFGTQASAVAAGGEPVVSTVEEWGGSSWSTAPNTISEARRNGGGSGSGEPSGVIFGGGEHPSYSTSTEEYDGTTWSPGSALPNGKLGVSAGDSATAALFAGDAQNPSPPYQSNVSQEYNGTSWTATPNLLIERGNGPSGASTGANSGGGAYYAGGSYPAVIASMETYNGSAWSTAPSLGTAVWNQGGNGSTAGALSVGGSLPAYTAAAEEFTAETATATASTLTTS